MKCDFCHQPIHGTYLSNFWGHNFHEHHMQEANRCISCTTYIMPSMGSMKLEDGNHICSNCLPEAILTRAHMEKCIHAVYQFFALGNMYFPKKSIVFKLVMESELPGDTLGRFVFQRNAYTVKIRKGLAKPVFCGVLAHELMHVYLHVHKHDFTLVEEEGLCEVVRYFVLRTINDRLSKATIKTLEESNDLIYGQGFRLMRSRIIEAGGSVRSFLADH